MATTINMGLEKPAVSATPGPEWAQMINTLLDKIDAHDHSSGAGKMVTPDGLDITKDLNLKENNATNLRSARFRNGGALSDPSDINAVYVASGDLFFRDAGGTPVQITSGGAVASSISGAFAVKTPGAYPYTVVSGDAQRVLLVDTSAARTINLPAATTQLMVMIKDSTGGAQTNPISVVPNGTNQIDGVNATRLLQENWGWWVLISDGVSKWSVGTMRDTANPVGSMQMYGGSSAPAGWLFCDGAAISRSTYARLFAILGTAYGVGDGSTTFNLPNMANRFPLGKASSGVGLTLGGAGGNIAQTATVPGHHHGMGAGADLAIAASGSHTHTIDHTHSAGSTNSTGAHVHDISHNHTMGSNGDHFHHMVIDVNTASGGSPTATDKGIARSFDAVNDFSYDIKSTDAEPGTVRTSTGGAHTHTVDAFSGNSASGGDHSHTVSVPAHAGNSGANTHSHTSGNFTGRIGKVTAGQDGNTDISAAVSSAPYTTVNYIIKF